MEDIEEEMLFLRDEEEDSLFLYPRSQSVPVLGQAEAAPLCENKIYCAKNYLKTTKGQKMLMQYITRDDIIYFIQCKASLIEKAVINNELSSHKWKDTTNSKLVELHKAYRNLGDSMNILEYSI